MLLNREERRALKTLLKGAWVIWFFLLHSYLAFPIAEFFMTPPVLVQEEGFLCAGHGCGCSTAKDCQESCCCYPDRNSDQASGPDKKPLGDSVEKNVVKVRLIEALKCQGHSPGVEAGLLTIDYKFLLKYREAIVLSWKPFLKKSGYSNEDKLKTQFIETLEKVPIFS